MILKHFFYTYIIIWRTSCKINLQTFLLGQIESIRTKPNENLKGYGHSEATRTSTAHGKILYKDPKDRYDKQKKDIQKDPCN